jgi:hypothetical protein
VQKACRLISTNGSTKTNSSRLLKPFAVFSVDC